MPSELHTERRGATLVLTLSDPASRNLLSKQVFAAGVEALDVVESDAAVRCIVLRGEGEHFCAGSSLPHAEESGEAKDAWLQRFHDFVEVLRVFPKPVIAAVEGSAAGSGFALALACDLIVAAEDASFSVSQADARSSPIGGTSWQLMQRVPRSLALQWMWLGQTLSAQQLHALGLVNWLAGHGQALAKALAIGDQLVRCEPDALAGIKELANQWPERSLAQQLDAERAQLLDRLQCLPGAGPA